MDKEVNIASRQFDNIFTSPPTTKASSMDTCDYKTAISCASRRMDWSEDEDGYELNDKSKLLIELVAAMFPNIGIGQVISDLNNAVNDLIEDSRENHTQDQDDASQRSEELQFNPPKNDD